MSEIIMIDKRIKFCNNLITIMNDVHLDTGSKKAKNHLRGGLLA